MVAFIRKQLNETWTILKGFKGNARACVIAEPLWGIPYNLFATYASVYMVALGCSDTQVGIIASVGLVFQMVFSLISGYVTDKLGRRRTSLVFDLISWSIPTLVWAFAQNFYFFIVAAIINSVVRIVHTSWSCLFVEDTKPEERVHVYTWISVAGILAGFFAPLAGFFVKRYELVPTMRGLYLFAFVMMTFMFFFRNALTHETKIGLLKMKETQNYRFHETWNEYKRIAFQLFKNPYTMIAFMLVVLNNIQITLKTSFLAILMTKGLGLPQESIAVFPAVNSAIMLLIYLFVMPTLGRFNFKKPLLIGYGILVSSNLVLILSPYGSFLMVLFSTMLGAIGAAVAYPFIDSTLANAIVDDDRAKIMSILYVILFAISAPFGYIGGLLSSISEKLPFLLIIMTFIISACLLAILTRMEKKQQTYELTL